MPYILCFEADGFDGSIQQGEASLVGGSLFFYGQFGRLHGACAFTVSRYFHVGLMTAVTGEPSTRTLYSKRKFGFRRGPEAQACPSGRALEEGYVMPGQRVKPPDVQGTADSHALQVDGLKKRYGKTVAVDGVAFTVRRGETFGLLGPNGAGKTTTLEIIAGLTAPDAGDVSVCGISIRKATQQAQRLLGVVPQGLALYEEMTAYQNLSYFARLRGLSGAERKRQIGEVLELVGLSQDARRKVAGFSGGMKRRLNIAIGLLGRPQVLLLDEPTVGIDPQSRRHILDSVRRLADEGMTILYTSHYMEEVEYLCQRIAIMDRGRIIAHGPIAEVRALAGDSVVLRIPAAAGIADAPFDLEKLRANLNVPMEVRADELRFRLPHGAAQVPSVLNTLLEHGVRLDGMRVDTPNLETVFLALTGKALRDPGADGVAS